MDALIWWFVGGGVVLTGILWLIAKRLEPQVMAMMRERMRNGDDHER